MTNTQTPFQPDWASPPGDTLADLLEETGMTQTELAERLGVTLKHVNRIVNGAATISADVALGLERVFGAPASFWMTREAHYQAATTRIEQRHRFRSSVDWAQRFPLTELRRRGFLNERVAGPDLVEELLRFFGIASPDQWRDPQAAFRKSLRSESDPYALAAWLREGELDAAAIECGAYDEQRFLEVLDEARGLTRLDPDGWWPELQKRCATAGVAVVIVKSYPGEKAHGATRWLSPDKALVQLSLRYRWEDIFWFSFFHEAGHVVLHRKKDGFLELAPKAQIASGTDLDLEHEANRFASHRLIPAVHERRLRSLTLAEVEGFAQQLGIAPAIVVGRLHHDKQLPYNHGNALRRRFVFTE